jgi:spermidine/putrescine transport system ATP-binding protein
MSPIANDGAEPHVVELQQVSRRFGANTAVGGLTLALSRGEFFSLLGPSGCGKTTTLRLIAGFDRPDAGRIMIMGRDVSLAPPNRRPVNTVFQNYALFSHLNVAENVEFGLRERGVPRGERAAARDRALALVRLSDYQHRRTQELSGGEQQRVALARAIVNQPSVLLLDEPLGALDLKLRRAMQEELKALQRRLGMTFLYVTHDQEEALLMSDRVGVMSRGRLEQVGAPEEVYARPASAFVADFVGEANILPAQIVEVPRSGRVTLRLPHDQIVTAACAPEAMGAAAGVLILRPERIRLEMPGAPGLGPRLPGTVESTFFVGAYRRFLVRVGQEVRLSVLSTDPVAAAVPGCAVNLAFDPEQAWFLPGETAAATSALQSMEGDHGHKTADTMARRL